MHRDCVKEQHEFLCDLGDLSGLDIDGVTKAGKKKGRLAMAAQNFTLMRISLISVRDYIKSGHLIQDLDRPRRKGVPLRVHGQNVGFADSDVLEPVIAKA